MKTKTIYLFSFICALAFFGLSSAYAQDSDGDGLSDSDEQNLYQTDPNNADTDADGLNDKFEVDNANAAGVGSDSGVSGYDPNDSDVDNDGLLDGQETSSANSTNSIFSQVSNSSVLSPFKADSDGDGRKDGDEVNGTTSNPEKTDPTDSDSDDDNLNDGDEISLGTDPNDSDSDDDGLTDGTEANPSTGIGTDPNDADSDDDGMTDKQEVDNGTDPNKADTDNDGLNDKEENDEGTTPNDADTDDDGLLDGEEIKGFRYSTSNKSFISGTSFNPTLAFNNDSDSDGCNDFSEVEAGNNPRATDSDKDGDGIKTCDGDCDDNNASIGKATTWYADTDGDRFGDANNPTSNCTQPTGYVANSTDCNDNDADVYPNAPAKADGKDNDCDGNTDKLSQTISFSLASATATFGDGKINLSSSASSGLSVTYTISGPATLEGNVLTITGAGEVKIVANQSGNDYYLAATSVSQSLNVSKASQTITFTAIQDQSLSQGSIALEASASSGLNVEGTVSGPASLSGTTLTFSSAGPVTVTMNQSGNDNYNAATAVARSFCINPNTPSISVENGSLLSSAPSGNIWYLNGQTIASATDATYTPTVDGEYSVQVSASGCLSSISAITNVTFTGNEAEEENNEEEEDEVLNVAPLPDDESLEVYPNPFDNSLTIENSSTTNLRFITLYSLSGERIFSKTDKNVETTLRGLDGLKPGIYWLVVSDGITKQARRVLKK